eukprot:jgi/Phyca11/102545/e_gw1.7.476.1
MSRPQQKRSRMNTAGEDGDTTTQQTTRLWTALEPPEITCFSREALVKWRRERELYEAAVHARCQESGESAAVVMIPAISTINRRRLKTFSELELKIPVDQTTNEKLVMAINQILASTMNDQIPNVYLIMSQHLKMDLRQKDVKARVLSYFDQIDELIEEYDQVLLFQDLDSTVKIKDKPAAKKRDDAPAQGCLHCKGSHWVNDCPIATEEQKKLARKAFVEQRKGAESSKMKRFMQNDEELAAQHVAFNGVVTMPYNLDNGTEYNVSPRKIMNEIREAQPDVMTTRLAKSIDGRAVGGRLLGAVILSNSTWNCLLKLVEFECVKYRVLLQKLKKMNFFWVGEL